MKKLFALLLLVMFAFVMEASAGNETLNYVKSGGKTYFCEKVRLGLFCANIALEDGNTLKIPLSKVDAYFCKGNLYERLPMIRQGVATGCTAMMEYVTTRNGLRLYKYSEFNECGDLLDNTYKKPHLQTAYFVYKDGEFYLEVDKRNAPTVLPFFGIDVI